MCVELDPFALADKTNAAPTTRINPLIAYQLVNLTHFDMIHNYNLEKVAIIS